MTQSRARLILVAAALALGAAGAAIGSHRVAAPPPEAERPLAQLEPFAVAELLAAAPPDTVVITLDAPAHPLRGALPASAFGTADEDLYAHAPRARRLILAGADPIRVDRVARRLVAGGRRVAVLRGGVEAWDRSMDADPAPPPAGASAETRRRYRARVALRRSFGDAAAAADAPVIAPAPIPLAAPSGPKKREGC